MNYWTPIFRQILESSVWEEEPAVRVLWITILLVASEPGRDGEIDMTVRALSARACLSPEDTRKALDRLMAPDPSSRSTADEGRRLVPTSEARGWGWRVVNWDAYAEARESAFHSARQQRYRDRHAPSRTVTQGHDESPGTTQTHGKQRPITKSHTVRNVDQEKEKEKEKEIPSDFDRTPPPFDSFWESYPRKEAKKQAAVVWEKLSAGDKRLALAAVVVFSEAWEGAHPDREQFIPLPATWLNGGRWADDPAQWRKSAHPNGNGKPHDPTEGYRNGSEVDARARIVEEERRKATEEWEKE